MTERLYAWTHVRRLRGECVQVRLEVLSDAWEPLASSARDVGPFDDVEDIELALWASLHVLLRRQIPGQLELVQDPPPR